MDVMYHDSNEEEKSAAQRQGRERPALRETISGSREVKEQQRGPRCHIVLRKDRHHSRGGARVWSPTLVAAPTQKSEALPGNLSLDMAVSVQEGGG